MKGPPLGPSGEDITWPDPVAPRGRKTSSTRKTKPQTSNLEPFTLAQPSLWSPLSLRLSATLGFSLKMTITHVVLSIFSDSTS